VATLLFAKHHHQQGMTLQFSWRLMLSAIFVAPLALRGNAANDLQKMPGPASLDPNRGGLVKFAMSPKFLYTADMCAPHE